MKLITVAVVRIAVDDSSSQQNRLVLLTLDDVQHFWNVDEDVIFALEDLLDLRTVLLDPQQASGRLESSSACGIRNEDLNDVAVLPPLSLNGLLAALAHHEQGLDSATGMLQLVDPRPPGGLTPFVIIDS